MEPENPRTAAYEYERHVKELEKLIRDMLPYLSDGIGVEDLKKRVKALGLESK